VVVEETGSRAGVLKKGDQAIARWPRTVSAQVEEATEGWSEIPFGGDEGQWCLRLLHLDRLDELALDATRIGLRAWQLREELKRSRFDERFHLWELEAIRSIATGIGGILDTETLAEELISHLVALLGVRSAHLYLGDSPQSASVVGGFGPARLEDKDIEPAWRQGIYTDDLVALPLQTDAGTLGILVASDKEARAGTEPFAANDVRLLELFAVQVTVAMEYVRLTQESLERERLKRELEMAAVIQSHLHPQQFPDLEGYRLAVRSSSSRQVAGDTYDVLIRDDALIATVTDVSGKGVGAGMIASGVHAGVRLMVTGSRDLSEVASQRSPAASTPTSRERPPTIDSRPLPWSVSTPTGGSGRSTQVTSRCLSDVGTGRSRRSSAAVCHSESSKQQAIQTEAEDSDEEEFGVERIAEVAAELAEPTAEKLCEAILEAVEAFTDGATLIDDATLLVVERLP